METNTENKEMFVKVGDGVINLEIVDKDNGEKEYHQIIFDKEAIEKQKMQANLTVKGAMDSVISSQNITTHILPLKGAFERYIKKEKLEWLDKFLVILQLDNIEKMKEVAKGEERLEKLVDEIISINNDPEIRKKIIEERQQQKAQNQ